MLELQHIGDLCHALVSKGDDQILLPLVFISFKSWKPSVLVSLLQDYEYWKKKKILLMTFAWALTMSSILRT